MLTDTSRWSHTRGNEVVPSRWQRQALALGTGLDQPAHRDPPATRRLNDHRPTNGPRPENHSAKPDRPADLVRLCAATQQTKIHNYGKTINECRSVVPG